MNNVYLVTQEKYRVKNQVENQARCTSTETDPADPTCAHRPRAPGRVVGGLAVLWPSPPTVSQRKAAVSQRSQRAPARPRIRSSCRLQRPRACCRSPSPPRAPPARLRLPPAYARSPSTRAAQRPERPPAACAPARAPNAHARAPSAHARAPSAHACALACRIVALQRAVLQYSPYLRPLLSQYNFFFFLYCDTIFLQPSCNTILQC